MTFLGSLVHVFPVLGSAIGKEKSVQLSQKTSKNNFETTNLDFDKNSEVYTYGNSKTNSAEKAEKLGNNFMDNGYQPEIVKIVDDQNMLENNEADIGDSENKNKNEIERKIEFDEMVKSEKENITKTNILSNDDSSNDNDISERTKADARTEVFNMEKNNKGISEEKSEKSTEERNFFGFNFGQIFAGKTVIEEIDGNASLPSSDATTSSSTPLSDSESSISPSTSPSSLSSSTKNNIDNNDNNGNDNNNDNIDFNPSEGVRARSYSFTEEDFLEDEKEEIINNENEKNIKNKNNSKNINTKNLKNPEINPTQKSEIKKNVLENNVPEDFPEHPAFQPVYSVVERESRETFTPDSYYDQFINEKQFFLVVDNNNAIINNKNFHDENKTNDNNDDNTKINDLKNSELDFEMNSKVKSDIKNNIKNDIYFPLPNSIRRILRNLETEDNSIISQIDNSARRGIMMKIWDEIKDSDVTLLENLNENNLNDENNEIDNYEDDEEEEDDNDDDDDDDDDDENKK